MPAERTYPRPIPRKGRQIDEMRQLWRRPVVFLACREGIHSMFWAGGLDLPLQTCIANRVHIGAGLGIRAWRSIRPVLRTKKSSGDADPWANFKCVLQAVVVVVVVVKCLVGSRNNFEASTPGGRPPDQTQSARHRYRGPALKRASSPDWNFRCRPPPKWQGGARHRAKPVARHSAQRSLPSDVGLVGHGPVPGSRSRAVSSPAVENRAGCLPSADVYRRAETGMLRNHQKPILLFKEACPCCGYPRP